MVISSFKARNVDFAENLVQLEDEHTQDAEIPGFAECLVYVMGTRCTKTDEKCNKPLDRQAVWPLI